MSDEIDFDDLKNIDDASLEEGIKSVLDALVTRSRQEQRKSDAWNKLFAASEHGLQELLSEAFHQTNGIILNLSNVIEERFEIEMTNELFNLLKALPFSMTHLRKTIETEQGLSCCADKARRIYYEEVLDEINRIRGDKPNVVD